MKYCDSCGQELAKEDLFCPKCGQSIQTITSKNPKQKKEGLGTASMIIGIISLVLAFVINILIFPIALIGLILGIVNKAQHGKKISGIVLNGIAMFLSIIVFIAVIILLTINVIKNFDGNYNEYREYIPSAMDQESMIGRWSCKKTKRIGDKDYELSVIINDNDTFSMYENKESKNYIEGKYEYTKDAFGTIIKTKRMYALELSGEKEYINGNYVGETNSEYKMIVTKVKGNLHAVLYNDDTDINYYCTK